MGVDATSKQTGGKDCLLEGAGLYYHTFIAVDKTCFGNISNCSSMMIWKHWFLCWTAWCVSGKTNLNLTWYFFSQLRRRSAARTGWVSLHGHLGALLLSTSSEIPWLCTCPCFRISQIFFVDVFFLVVFAYCLSFITTSCSLIVVPSRGLNDSADTSSPISKVSP